MAECTTHRQTWDMNPGPLDYQSKALNFSQNSLHYHNEPVKVNDKEAENYPLAASSTAMRPGKTGDQGKPLVRSREGNASEALDTGSNVE